MFTGIIEEVGRVYAIKRGAKSSVLSIEADLIFEDLKIGDSVSTNGVCLTVAKIDNKHFTVDVMNETWRCSSLGQLKHGDLVNLERAMPLNGRFGGHIVSGHIDGTGKIISIKKDDNAIWYTIQTEPKIMRYIVEKGSIAIDGISLTVAKVKEACFSVSIIPHTLKATCLSQKVIGSSVNLENDLIGKYIEKLTSTPSHIDEAFLLKYGF